MKTTSGMLMGAFMAALLGSGLGMAVEDTAKAGVKNAEATAEAAEFCAGQAAIPQSQKVQIPGVTLINPENAEEAVLLVQMMAPGPEGKPMPRMVGIPLNMDENGKKLVGEYGVSSGKPGDVEGAKKTQKEAMEKFVMVSGVVNFDTGAPILTVEKYESAKELLSKAQAEASSAPAEATVPAVN